MSVIKARCMLDLPFFDGLLPEEKLGLLRFVRKKLLKKGEILYYDGNPVESVYLVKEGRVKLSKCFRDGKEVIIGFRGTDEILGEEALFKDYEHNSTAVITEDSFICVCRKKDFEKVIKENPKLAIKIIKNLGQKLQDNTIKISNMVTRNVRERVRFLLSQLAREYGIKTNKGLLIDLKLTHQEIADLVGASRVMVSRVLSELDEISTNRGEILISDKVIS